MWDMLLALLMALLCIGVHFEALLVIEKLAGALSSVRRALLLTWVGLLIAHVLQIWLYALVYYLAVMGGVGQLAGAETISDYAYYSAVVYTTLGFGDLVPDAGLQLLTGSEALVGLSMIAWSATITYGRVRQHQRDSGV